MNAFKVIYNVSQFPTPLPPPPQPHKAAAAISTTVLSACQEVFPLANIEYMFFKFQK